MKLNNSQAIINAVKAEWVEVNMEQFNNMFLNQDGHLCTLGYEQVWGLDAKPFLLYCQGTKKYYAEKSIYESMQPKRKTGWYRVRLHNAFYDKKKELVVYYNDSDNIFNFGCDLFDESDFEWIDDKPIEFPS